MRLFQVEADRRNRLNPDCKISGVEIWLSGLTNRDAIPNSAIATAAAANHTGRPPMDPNELLAQQDAARDRDADTISNWRSYWKIPEEGGRFNGYVLRKIFIMALYQ